MVRRIVTAVTEGRSVIADDRDVSPVAHLHTPGFAQAVVWATDTESGPTTQEPTRPLTHFVPGPGQTVALTVTFPPDSVFGDSSFDPSAASAENLANSPGLAELFESDAPGMHTTPTMDYAVVLEGELVLEVDDGASTTLRAGDIVIQNGARHAWRVPADRPATIFVVLIGKAGR